MIPTDENKMNEYHGLIQPNRNCIKYSDEIYEPQTFQDAEPCKMARSFFVLS